MADTAKISHAHPMRRIAVWASGVVLLLLVVCAVTLALRPALLARPAVYRVQIEPPEAALAATGRAVSIEGEGPARTVTVAEPDGRREVVLVATRRGYENLVHWLTPRPGDAETVDLRLRRLKEPEATPPPRQESVPPKLATPPSHSEAAARPEVAELPLQPPKDPAPSRPQTVAPQTAAPQASPNHQEIAFDLGHGVKLELVRIPAGEFLMGSPKSDNNALGDEKPQHRVQITRPFYLGKYLVTQEQWQAVMGSNPSGFKGPKNPVENVSWDDCQEFLGKLRKKFGAGRGKFQLPTEAQWEYACRAGSTTRWCCGDSEAALGDYAWYNKNAKSRTHPVGEKKPNAWGLYDMHGNVWEWCQDLYGGDYYGSSPTKDPAGPTQGAYGSYRVDRGGSWDLDAKDCRSANRSGDTPDSRYNLGLRVCQVPEK
ncbi:MAG: SUMF1/EgtB/PvdO family nonheme iron enzyme [Thermoguttaceae bacterium]